MWSKVVRWIGALPSAIVAGWLAYLFVMFVNGVFFMRSSLMRSLLEVAAHGTAGAIYCWAGTKMSPTHRTYAALILSSLAIMFAGAMLVLWLLSGADGWVLPLDVLAVAVGAGYVTFLLIRDGPGALD